jgi:hypothetical protein
MLVEVGKPAENGKWVQFGRLWPQVWLRSLEECPVVRVEPYGRALGEDSELALVFKDREIGGLTALTGSGQFPRQMIERAIEVLKGVTDDERQVWRRRLVDDRSNDVANAFSGSRLRLDPMGPRTWFTTNEGCGLTAQVVDVMLGPPYLGEYAAEIWSGSFDPATLGGS